jgi:hypothetical protein
MHIWTSHDVFWLENEGVPCFREWQPMEHYLGSTARALTGRLPRVWQIAYL